MTRRMDAENYRVYRDMTRITCRFDEDTYKEIEEFATRTQQPAAEAVRRLVQWGLICLEDYNSLANLRPRHGKRPNSKCA